MAATEATHRRTKRNAARRGDHGRPTPTAATMTEPRAVTPAMHVTPNVVIAARGGIRSARRATPARALRRFAV